MEIVADVKKIALPFAVLLGASIWFGLVSGGKNTPAFLLPKA